ncbi:rhomboid family intramembrane serine protease [soil metagenome]
MLTAWQAGRNVDTSPNQPQDPDRGIPASVPTTTCYRHHDRPTRLSCSACSRPICVDCTNQASVGQKCPECAAPVGRNRIITAAEVRARTTGLGGAPVTRVLLYTSVAIGILGLVAPAVWAPIATELIHSVQAVSGGEIYRAVTAALLHSPQSPFHLLFNMWALYVFGPELERRFGSLPFFAFYVAAAAAGGLAFQLSREVGSALGASGAIFGLFGAYVTSAYLSRHTAAGRAGLNQLLPLLLLNLALPLLIPNIAWEAHLGGLVAGGLIMLGWRRVGEDRGPVPTSGNPVMTRTAIAGAVLIVCLGALFVL